MYLPWRNQPPVLGRTQSPREKELGLGPYEVKYEAPRVRGYSGAELRQMRKYNGVGRPAEVNKARTDKLRAGVCVTGTGRWRFAA
jgi:hypothetical protein